MALRDVGGKSVYIIDAGTVDSAKTSAGTGYAQLVSQLRWQIWEASKEAVAQQIQFEKMGYQAQLDVFAKQQAELQKSLSKLRDIKNKVASGVLDPKDALRLAIADANTELSNERNELKAAGGGSDYTITETQAKTATGKPRVDEDGNPVMIRTVRYKAGTKGASQADAAKAGGADAVAKPSSRYEDILAKFGGDADAALESRAAEISAELSGLRAPSVPTIDVIGRTREGFGEMAGVGGFGFARRPTKSSPIYDEAKAKRELFGADSPQNINNLVQQMADDDYILRKTEILSTYPEGKVFTPMEEERLRQDALIGARKKVERAYLSSESGVTAPVSARKFMTGDRDLGRQGNLPPVLKRDPFEEPEPTPAPPARPARRVSTPPPRDPAFQDFIDRAEAIDIEPYEKPPAPPALPAAPFYEMPQSMRPDAPPPLVGAGPGSLPYQEEELVFGGGVVPSDRQVEIDFLSEPPAPVTPPRMVPAAPAAPASKVSDIDIDIAEDNDPDIFRKALEYFKASPNKDIATNPPAYFAGKKPGQKMLAGEGQREMVRKYLEEVDQEETDNNKIRIKGGKLDPDLARDAEGEVANLYRKASSIDSYIEGMDPTEQEKQELYNAYQDRMKDVMFMSDKELSEFYIQKLNEMRKPTSKPTPEATEGSLPKTRQQRAASYALNIIQKGRDLASKPEKLARIAKTNLPENQRSKQVPEHIALVDKLYDINLSKGDVYKSTYSEIARVYEKQPKLRDAALEYLVAKNLLFGNIS
jgi:hypothetical protein